MGVLPEALVNYLALLGWAPTGGTREIFSPAELKKEFSLERVTPAAAMFDMEKLYWLNRHYIKSWPVGNLVALGAWFLSQAGYIELKDAKWLSAESFPVIRLRRYTSGSPGSRNYWFHLSIASTNCPTVHR